MLDPLAKALAVDRVSVANEKSWDVVARKGFDDLLGCPFSRRMLGDVDMSEHPPIMAQDDEGEQDPEGGGRNSEEVDGDDLTNVVVQEGSPRLRWRLAMSRPILTDGCFGDLVPQQCEF